jgi:hypothetical protein
VGVPAVSGTIEVFARHEVRMSTNEAARAIAFHELYLHVEVLGRSEELPFDLRIACFRGRVEVG